MNNAAILAKFPGPGTFVKPCSYVGYSRSPLPGAAEGFARAITGTSGHLIGVIDGLEACRVLVAEHCQGCQVGLVQQGDDRVSIELVRWNSGGDFDVWRLVDFVPERSERS